MRKKIEEAFSRTKNIKLRLDHRTIITIKSRQALESWLDKFPQAKLIV